MVKPGEVELLREEKMSSGKNIKQPPCYHPPHKTLAGPIPMAVLVASTLPLGSLVTVTLPAPKNKQRGGNALGKSVEKKVTR